MSRTGDIYLCVLLKRHRNLLDDDFFSKLAEEAEKDVEVSWGQGLHGFVLLSGSRLVRRCGVIFNRD